MSEADIKIDLNSVLMEGDFLFSGNDLSNDSGLVSSVLVSLFSDRRAYDDDPLPEPDRLDRRGWWGDLTSDDDGDKIGSRWWLLGRSKATQENLLRCKRYAEEALQWLIEDGIAVKIETEAEILGNPESRILAIRIGIWKQDGNSISVRFESQWEETFDVVQ